MGSLTLSGGTSRAGPRRTRTNTGTALVVGVVGVDSIALVALHLGDGVLLERPLSTGQGGVAAWSGRVGLEDALVVVVRPGTFAVAVDKVFVGRAKLQSADERSRGLRGLTTPIRPPDLGCAAPPSPCQPDLLVSLTRTLRGGTYSCV